MATDLLGLFLMFIFTIGECYGLVFADGPDRLDASDRFANPDA